MKVLPPAARASSIRQRITWTSWTLDCNGICGSLGFLWHQILIVTKSRVAFPTSGISLLQMLNRSSKCSLLADWKEKNGKIYCRRQLARHAALSLSPSLTAPEWCLRRFFAALTAFPALPHRRLLFRRWKLFSKTKRHLLYCQYRAIRLKITNNISLKVKNKFELTWFKGAAVGWLFSNFQTPPWKFVQKCKHIT